MKQIGIYAGTFDPVHPGHVAFALETLRKCRLDKVVFLPEQQPRYKRAVTDISHRVSLLREVTATAEGLEVMQLDSESFTIAETLPELRKAFPGDSLVFLVGSDVAQGSLRNWPGIKQLLEEVSFAVGVRAKDSAAATNVVMKQLYAQYGLELHYTLIEADHAAFTSSQIRNKSHDESVVNPAVTEYIKRHGLYS